MISLMALYSNALFYFMYAYIYKLNIGFYYFKLKYLSYIII